MEHLSQRNEIESADASDRRRLGELFDRDFDDLYRFCLARVGSAALAEDIACDAFHAAAAVFGRGEGSQVDRPWLFVVARNRIVDHWRAEGRRRRRDDRVRSLRAVDQQTALDEQSQSVSEHTLRALASLPQRQRAALVLRYLEEKSVSEIAEELNVEYRAAESLLARARRSFSIAWRSR